MNKYFKSRKGQITIGIALLGAIATVGASFLTGWFGTSKRVSDVEKDVAVIEERENLHYIELRGDIQEMKTEMRTGFAELKTLIKEK